MLNWNKEMCCKGNLVEEMSHYGEKTSQYNSFKSDTMRDPKSYPWSYTQHPCFDQRQTNIPVLQEWNRVINNVTLNRIIKCSTCHTYSFSAFFIRAKEKYLQTQTTQEFKVDATMVKRSYLLTAMVEIAFFWT